MNTQARSIRLLLFSSLLGLMACGTDEDPIGTTFYYDDVRPILAEHCNACHMEGAVAPFTLTNYDDAKMWGPAMAAAVEARSMPPFNVNNDGSCNTFTDANWLSDTQIATIKDWVAGGYLEGNSALAAPEIRSLPVLTGDSMETVGFGSYEAGPTDDHPFDDYQCFEIALDIDSEKYLVGYEVEADNVEIVHHLLGFRVDPARGANRTIMNDLEAATPGPGWDCFGAAGRGVLPSGVPVTWAPGTGALEFPEGTGIRFAPGDVMVVQVHYNIVNGPGVDASQIKLKWADTVEWKGASTY